MKKILTLLTAVLIAMSAIAAVTGSSTENTPGQGSAPSRDASLTATGGSITAKTTDSEKSFAVESATYNAAVTNDDMKAANEKGLKVGANALYREVTGTFKAGDVVTICGYNPWKVSSNTDMEGNIASSITTGTSKTDYNIGSYTLTADASTLIFSRAEATGTAISAIKIIRPAPAPTTKIVYLNLSGYTNWENDNATFQLWDGTTNYNFTAVEGCAEHIYSCEIAISANAVYFKRCSSMGAEWNAVHVEDLGSNNLLSVTGWTTGNLGVYAPSYSVIFNTNGHGTAPSSECVVSGQKATAPSAPTAANWTFAGWYKEEECTNAFDFANTNITEDITLYAKWTENLSTEWTLMGSFDSWGAGYAFTKKAGENTGTTAYCTVPLLSANKEYQFKLKNGSKWYSQTSLAITSNNASTEQTLSVNNSLNGNVSLTTQYPGNYTFKIDFSTGTSPKISVVYAGAVSMYENFFANNKKDNNAFYTVTGNLANDMGTVNVTMADGTPVTLDYCLKMETSTSITFTTATACTLKLVMGAEGNTINVDGESEQAGANGVITKDITAGSHTLTKAGEGNLFYINLYDFKNTLAAQSGENHYATFSSDKAVKFTDATVYTVSVSNNTIALHEVENKQVPANTGVLLKSSSTSATYYYINSADALEDNMLHPASEAMTGSYTFYKLAYNNYQEKTDLGFYWGADNGAAFTCKAGTAYLAVPVTSAPARTRFVLGATEETGTATDVEAVEAQEEVVKFFENGQLLIKKNGVVYNVMGQIVR